MLSLVLETLGAAPAGAASPGADLAIPPGGLALSSNYITAGDLVAVNVTIDNRGDTAAAAVLQVFVGDPATSLPFAQMNISVLADSSTVSPAWLNTSLLEGWRKITARLVGISPPENGSASDNSASLDVRIHAPVPFDRLLEGTQSATINDATFFIKGFFTIRGNASLEIGPTGSLYFDQKFDGQFDLLLQDNATLRLSGGRLESNRALTVFVEGRATVSVGDGSSLLASVVTSSSGAFAAGHSTLEADRLIFSGTPAVFDGTTLTAGQASFSGATLTVKNASFSSPTGVVLAGGSSTWFIDSTISVRGTFPSLAAAEAVFPGISSSGPGPVPYQPAVSLSGGATADFIRTAVSSLILIEGSGTQLVSSVPVAATDASHANIYRSVLVMVGDPAGAPVRNATVDILDYILKSLVTSAVAAEGSVDLLLLSDFITAGFESSVSNYLVRTRAASVTSPETSITLPRLPDLSPSSLRVIVPITLAIFAPWGLYEESEPQLVFDSASTVSGPRTWFSDVNITADLTLSDADIELVQSRDFEHYIVVSSSAQLNASFSSIRSNYRLNIYLLDGAGASFDSARLVNLNLLLSNAGDLSFIASWLVGSLIGSADTLSVDSSFVGGGNVDAAVTGNITLSNSVITATNKLDLRASRIDLNVAGLSGTFEPFDPVNATALDYFDFEAQAVGAYASLTSSPVIRLSAATVLADRFTVWTGGNLSAWIGPGNSTLSDGWLLAGTSTFVLLNANLTAVALTCQEGSQLAFDGNGNVTARGVSPYNLVVGLSVTYRNFVPVPFIVLDDVGLPIQGATVTAVPILPSSPAETAGSDGEGVGTLYLLASTTTGSRVTSGPSYRISAVRDGAESDALTWTPGAPSPLTLALPRTFATVSGDASFALVLPRDGASSSYRLVSTNLPNTAAVAFFLSSWFGGRLPEIVETGPAYPNSTGQVFVSADYVFASGTRTVTRPMAGQTALVRIFNGTEVSVTLDAEGQGRGSLALPPVGGSYSVVFEAQGALLASPFVASANLTVDFRPKIFITASLVKSELKPSENIKMSGRATFENGSPVANAAITINWDPDRAPVLGKTDPEGFFFAILVAPKNPGAFAIIIQASAVNTEPERYALNYTVISGTPPPPPPPQSNLRLLPLFVGLVGSVASGVALAYLLIRRRVTRGELVECGNCGKPTPAEAGKCRSCGVEFDPVLAKCSNCGSWMSVAATECPQCHTAFAKRVGLEPVSPIPSPAGGATAEYITPASMPLSALRAPPAERLEDLEFRLPGTTETLDLGEKGTAPTFVASGMTPPPQPKTAEERAAFAKSMERVELPRFPEEASPVKELAPGESGASMRRAPVSLGTANIDLARTSPAITATKEETEREQLPPDEVLRELLMKAAPELGSDMLPKEIQRELQEIAKGEAPIAAEKRQAARPAERTPIEERPVEAPEKSRKSAFDMLSSPPPKPVTVGPERRGVPVKDAGGKPVQTGAAICPNCGGNWIIQRDGKNSCRVCGTRW